MMYDESKDYWLVSVLGLTPQVVTETLYALHKQGRQMPSRIVLITTSKGFERARLELIVNDRLGDFCRDYQVQRPQFDEHDILVPNDQFGKPMEDARNQADHDILADFITNTIRELVNDSPALHASLAGGRKTMTFFIGYAMSLFGRTQDELSHVLVSEPYEFVPKFFYPTPYTDVVYDNKDKPLDPSKATVDLAPIAFVRLSSLLRKSAVEKACRYVDFVDQFNVQRKLAEDPSIIFYPDGKTVDIHGSTITFPPTEWLFYFFVCKSEGVSNVENNHLNALNYLLVELGRLGLEEPEQCFPKRDITTELLQCIDVLKNSDSAMDTRLTERSLSALAGGMKINFFNGRKLRVNSAIEKALGPNLAARYKIVSVDTAEVANNNRAVNVFGVDVEQEFIQYAMNGS
ncbi:TIGR02584 family CRISPR-associated protein [Neiella sp. HB171785]|uniref:TIGR02584 family CRISPR-associated protein n=1 Tax=Neiella litorisoli TaxID=2771431 RepID=A0A8J6QIF3_9GAMM|nr:CRISPR-associated ring nuclease Csm6 [Neiella litorisoli]MBD1389288.1 TIGR02584 family CRISPR-associated protein [Neiella litorisoli]